MEDIKTKALQAHSEGRLIEAELSYRALLEESDDHEVAVNLGALLRSQKRVREASSHYHRYLKRWPDQRDLLLNACNCWKETGENSTAIGWLRQATKTHPVDLNLIEALAEALYLDGKTTEAINSYESVVHTDPSRIKSWLGLGIVNAHLGQLKTSENCFQKALTINPNEPLAKANLLTIFKQKGDFEAAHQLIGTLSEELSQHPNIRKAIADISLAEGDSVTASHYLSELAISNPNCTN